MGTFGKSNVADVVFNLCQVAFFFEHPGNFLSRFEAIFTNQYLCFFIQCSILVEDVNHLEVVFESEFVVVGIMCRRYLEAPRTELHRNVFILDNGNAPVDEGHVYVSALKMTEAFIFWVNADGSIGHDSLWPYCCDGNKLIVATFEGIAYVVELGLYLAMLDFIV